MMIAMRLLRLPLALLAAGLFVPANSQWLFYHEKDTPMKDGKPDLLAKTPRTFDGHPDLSGVWAVEHSAPGEIERLYGAAVANGPQATAGDDIRDMNKYFLNLFIDYKRGEEPIRPEWRKHEAEVRQARAGENNSTLHCMPYPMPTKYFNIRPFKLWQTSKELGMYSEMDGNFRWIHLDGRPLPGGPVSVMAGGIPRPTRGRRHSGCRFERLQRGQAGPARAATCTATRSVSGRSLRGSILGTWIWRSRSTIRRRSRSR